MQCICWFYSQGMQTNIRLIINQPPVPIARNTIRILPDDRNRRTRFPRFASYSGLIFPKYKKKLDRPNKLSFLGCYIFQFYVFCVVT